MPRVSGKNPTPPHDELASQGVAAMVSAEVEEEIQYTDEELIRMGNQRLIPLVVLLAGILIGAYLLSPILVSLIR
jgi:hypothetical protein